MHGTALLGSVGVGPSRRALRVPHVGRGHHDVHVVPGLVVGSVQIELLDQGVSFLQAHRPVRGRAYPGGSMPVSESPLSPSPRVAVLVIDPGPTHAESNKQTIDAREPRTASMQGS
jgi:hypothetical protein